MEESVNVQIEQMFGLSAKLDLLTYGVGRTTLADPSPESEIRLDAQKRECEDAMVFHAGRAIELAMSIVYARGADRILGREYPGVSKEQMRDDRQTHNLWFLYKRIREDLSDRNIVDAFEDLYQQALHRGVIDLVLDENVVASVLLRPDTPFWEVSASKVRDGAELTQDHADYFDSMFRLTDEKSDFQKMRHDNFEQFLKKADASYYRRDTGNKERRNMTWARYGARDSEYGRARVTIGIRFFGRLVKGIIELSRKPWMWDQGFLERWYSRRVYNIRQRLRHLAMQNFDEEVSFPTEMTSLDKFMKFYERSRFEASGNLERGYARLHSRWRFKT